MKRVAPGAETIDATRPAFRVAFVGVGPKGLYGLERLAIEVCRGAMPGPLDLHLFEPHPHPGAGPVYDPRQPHYLRMNFANRHVDLWSRPDRAEEHLPFARPTLVDYLAEHHPAFADPDAYAPRAVVGEYLHRGFLDLVAWLRQRTALTLHRRAVEAVERHGGRWLVRAGEVEVSADEVLIATGHDSRQLDDDLPRHPRVVQEVFPVDRLGEIPPEARVAIRGFGLTSLDAALALTEGRGGRFEGWDDPAALVYRPGDREVRSLVPYSRTGRPMVPKPDVRLAGSWPELEPIWRQGRRQLDAAEEPAIDAIFSTLGEAADRALSRTGHAQSAASAARHLDRLCSGPPEKLYGKRLEEQLVHALEVAIGRRPPDAEWALGLAWRNLYPALVRLVEARRLDATTWPSFARLAREMERVAFGPPAENAARYLALVRAGNVDLGVADDPAVAVDDAGITVSSRDGARTADVLVNAVLAPPGAAPRSSDLLQRLREAGHLRTLPWNDGLEVRPDGRCVGADGRVTPGLSAVGRPTEGCVLGNDTLSRTLHATPERWARSLSRRSPLARRARERQLEVHR